MDSNQKSAVFFFVFFFLTMSAMSYFTNDSFGLKNIFATFVGALVGTLVFYFLSKKLQKKKVK